MRIISGRHVIVFHLLQFKDAQARKMNSLIFSEGDTEHYDPAWVLKTPELDGVATVYFKREQGVRWGAAWTGWGGGSVESNVYERSVSHMRN